MSRGQQFSTFVLCLRKQFHDLLRVPQGSFQGRAGHQICQTWSRVLLSHPALLGAPASRKVDERPLGKWNGQKTQYKAV